MSGGIAWYRGCPWCGEYDNMAEHECKPVWFCREEDEAEPTKVRAKTGEQAAEKYAAELCEKQVEYYTRTILVRSEHGASVFRYIVDFRQEPVYTARLARTQT